MVITNKNNIVKIPELGSLEILDQLYNSNHKQFRLLSLENEGYNKNVYTHSSTTPQLPSVIWRHILNFILYHYLPDRCPVFSDKLNDSKDSKEWASELALLIRDNKSLRSLNLSFNLMMDGVGEIAHVLANDNNTLQHLNLNENGIGEVGAMELSKMIERNTGLESLILDTNRFGEGSLRQIISSLEMNKQIKKISLAMVGNIDGQQLGQYIQNSPKLEHLNLMVNEFGRFGQCVFDSVVEHPNIQTLNLSYTKIRSSESKAGLQRMIEQNQKITTLNLSYAFIDSDVTDIMRALLFNKTLTSMDLSLNSIESIQGAILGAYLLTNKSLISLNLGGNILGTSGTSPILNALLYNNTLKTLNLRKNQIKVLEENVIFQVLSKNTTLTSLDLYQNSLSTNIGHEIACGLAVNHTLTSIDLSCNEFGVECADSFQQSLVNNNSLRYINLIGNGFGRQPSFALHATYKNRFEQFKIEDGNSSNPKPAITFEKLTTTTLNNNNNNNNNNSFPNEYYLDWFVCI
ncbi:hypothetical protein PPL_09840 [Heterostelium album PN500]|uniref:Leucine-rich repeat-containing protein n=1 Tax=Heterostelium pallidum (strain ATCC 26659 / Pp 5 / PN500) TaxID=670386 RepID=D3BP77_HETP5|nr:hypothetical protein PPL_09840 [Heterostelium album PN500]EFA77087.1 hypothetical protein PPL_09840 [Heterostelium album PN500]|eukprot:XP_020429216.1 hypothetical protein PPL_09840 [Heterostelium album PN500]